MVFIGRSGIIATGDTTFFLGAIVFEIFLVKVFLTRAATFDIELVTFFICFFVFANFIHGVLHKSITILSPIPLSTLQKTLRAQFPRCKYKR